MKYSEREANYIIADSFKEINYKQKKLLLASVYEDNPERQKYAAALIKIIGAGVYNKIKAEFCDGNYRSGVIAALEKRRIECVTLRSAEYPELLKNTDAPPLVLYLRGNARLIKDRLFGVVGSRKTPPYAAETCKKVVGELTSRFTIVTGVADGGDSAAVAGAIDSGRIICVLPCGHDSGSATNPALVREVEKRGLTVSEFPPLSPALKYTFLLRNRIIAGLCEGVLVVSAPQKSGALSTANYASNYSRDVFAFPYNAGVEPGAGCNALIKGGAALCENANDIFAAYGFEKSKQKETQLDGGERAALNLLKEEGELHLERIAAALGKKLFEVITVCSSLEIKGLIIKTGGNKYAAL